MLAAARVRATASRHSATGSRRSRSAGGGRRLTHALGTSAAEVRVREGERYFAAVAEPLAALCHRMSERFGRGGRLLALGRSPQARSDARHVAVEFVHPVIVGKRALPALALTRSRRSSTSRPRRRTSSCAFDPRRCADGPCGSAAVRPSPSRPRRPSGSSTRGRRIRSSPRSWPRPRTTCCGSSSTCSSNTAAADAPTAQGASSFLYPFLGEARDNDLDAVLADVRALGCWPRRRRSARCGRRRLRGKKETSHLPRAQMRNRLEAGGRQGPRLGQRRLGDGRDGRRRRPRASAARLAGAARARPHRRHGRDHRGRQRHRGRGDLRPPGHRPRARAEDVLLDLLDQRGRRPTSSPRWRRGGGAG